MLIAVALLLRIDVFIQLNPIGKYQWSKVWQNDNFRPFKKKILTI